MTTQNQQRSNESAQEPSEKHFRFYVWFNDPNDRPEEEEYEKRGPFDSLADAEAYAKRRALDGFSVDIETVTPLTRALEKGAEPFHRYYLEARRESIAKEMRAAGYSCETIAKATRHAKVFGLHYGRALGFTASDPWAKFEGIDANSKQNLIDKGWNRFTIEIAENYADQSFWASRLQRMQRELAAELAAKNEAEQ